MCRHRVFLTCGLWKQEIHLAPYACLCSCSKGRLLCSHHLCIIQKKMLFQYWYWIEHFPRTLRYPWRKERIAPFPVFSFQNKLLKYFTSCIFFLHLPKVFQKKFLSLLDKFTLYWTNIKVFFIHVSICLMTSLIFTVQSIWGQIWYSPLFCIPGHYASYSKKSARLQELFSWFDLSKVLKGT